MKNISLIKACDLHFSRLLGIHRIYGGKTCIYGNRENECLCNYGSWPGGKFHVNYSEEITEYEKKIYKVKCKAVDTNEWILMIKKLHPTNINILISEDDHKKQLKFVSEVVPPIIKDLKENYFDPAYFGCTPSPQLIFEMMMERYAEEYKIFLEEYKMDKDRYPNIYQALVWQSHMMNEVEYIKDCKNIFGDVQDFKYPKIIQV